MTENNVNSVRNVVTLPVGGTFVEQKTDVNDDGCKDDVRIGINSYSDGNSSGFRWAIDVYFAKKVGICYDSNALPIRDLKELKVGDRTYTIGSEGDFQGLAFGIFVNGEHSLKDVDSGIKVGDVIVLSYMIFGYTNDVDNTAIIKKNFTITVTQAMVDAINNK